MSVRPQIEVFDIFKTVVLTKISITPKCPMYDALQTLIFFGCALHVHNYQLSCSFPGFCVSKDDLRSE